MCDCYACDKPIGLHSKSEALECLDSVSTTISLNNYDDGY